MNFISRKLCVALVCAAVVITGCHKKPRPAPTDTTPIGTAAIMPDQVPTVGQSAAGLTPRTDGVIETADTIRGLLQAVYFDFDRSAIKQSERKKCQDAADYLAKTPQYRLMLEGHCDWRGTAEYNLGLGDRRAQEVKKFLQSLGVAADKLQILSQGSLGAIEKGSEDQMSKDRRVDFVILKK